MILLPISKLYGLITGVRNALYDRGAFRTYSLGARTISVGNLTTGGTGKTPLVALIAEMLLDEGETVCILTRGYGRRKPRARVLVSDGKRILSDAATGGDEPLEIATLLGGRAIIVADADRLSAGRWANEAFGVTAFVLDDGFQHRRLHRDLDIVCVDATDPCGDGRMLPAGRLRERLAGLKRADAIVITRSDLVKDVPSIEARLKKYNPSAPVFKASTRISGLAALQQTPGPTRVYGTPGGPAGAFCALGNPNAFFETVDRFLTETGDPDTRIVFRRAFPDHRSYTQDDIEEVDQKAKKAGVRFLVTSRKDAVKLSTMDLSLPCFVAEAELIIREPETFRRLFVPSTANRR